MKARRFTVSLDVRGALNSLARQRTGMTMLRDGNGRNLPPAEAMAALACELMKGNNRIPMSEECRNPCQHADKGCTGFDYKKSGCPGYEVEK